MYSIGKTYPKVLQEIAQRHKALRKAQKLTQAEHAKKAGVSLGSLKRFEQTGLISLDSLLKLANVLGRLEDFDTVFELKGDDMKTIKNLFSDDMK